MDYSSIPDFLAEQRDAAPSELQSQFMTFEDHWERKLWHQLTEDLVQYFEHPGSGPQRISVYKNFVVSFADKINQLQLVTLGLSAATQCKGVCLACQFNPQISSFRPLIPKYIYTYMVRRS